jgi:hypothetical protein
MYFGDQNQGTEIQPRKGEKISRSGWGRVMWGGGVVGCPAAKADADGEDIESLASVDAWCPFSVHPHTTDHRYPRQGFLFPLHRERN